MAFYQIDLRCLVVLFGLTVGAAGHTSASPGAPNALLHPEGTLELADRNLVPGKGFVLRGLKFHDDSELTLTLVGLSGRYEIGKIRTDSAGAFTTSLTVADSIVSGQYRLIALAADGDEKATLNVVVLPPAPDTHAEDDPNHAEENGPVESAMPSDEPLDLDRASSPVVTASAVAGILFALVAGGMLLSRRRDPVG